MATLLAGSLALSLILIGWAIDLIRSARLDPLAYVRAEFNTVHVKRPSYWERRILPFALRLAQRFPDYRELLLPINIDQRLAWAGSPRGLNVEKFYAIQLLAVLVAGSFGLYVGVAGYRNLLVGIAAGALLGAAGPWLGSLWLHGEANKRQREINLHLPDTLELVITAVAAGLTLDRAFALAISAQSGPLVEEIGRFLSELELGTPREEAYRRLLWRNRSDELQTVVGALLQGHSLGAPITETLSRQAETMRERRLQRAKEAGAQASPKIALVTTLLIVPTIFVTFLVLMGYTIFQDLGPVIGSLTGQ